MATKPAPARKAVKTSTPLLDAAVKTNPHRPEWNKEAAAALEAELKAYLLATKPIPDTLLHLLSDYGPLAGWKNVAKLITASFNGSLK